MSCHGQTHDTVSLICESGCFLTVDACGTRSVFTVRFIPQAIFYAKKNNVIATWNQFLLLVLAFCTMFFGAVIVYSVETESSILYDVDV